MKIKDLTAIIAVFLALATPVRAAQETWKCDINHSKDLKETTRVSFINGPVYLWIESGQKKANVADPLIQTVFKQPIEVVVKKDTNKIFKANWIVDGGKDAKGKTIPKFRYSLILQKPTGQLSFYASPIGYTNSFRFTGCLQTHTVKGLT